MDAALFNIFDLPMVLAIFVSLILASVLVFSGQPAGRNLLLAGYLYAIALVEMDKLVFWNAPIHQFLGPWVPVIFTFGKSIHLLVLAILYLYIRDTRLNQSCICCSNVYLLMVPAVGLILSSLLYFSLGKNPEFYFPSNYHSIFFNPWFSAFLLCKYGFFFSLTVLCFRTHPLNSTKRNISEKGSIIKDFNLVFVGTLCIYFFELVTDALSALETNAELLNQLGIVHNYMVLVYVCVILIHTLKGDIFKPLQKPKSYNLVKQRSIDLQVKDIHQLMEEHKYYLDAEITLEGLAKKLKMPEHQLSAILNKNFQKNFFDFINYYRTEHAKKLMSSDGGAGYSILNILYDSGFNSKSAFNRYFKKYTGVTPSEYRGKFKSKTLKNG